MSSNLCLLCPRQCHIDRIASIGYCGAKTLRVAKVMVHYWEEPIICGEKGSGNIFFSHCNLKCVYCQNYDISHIGKGKDISVLDLVKIFENLERKNVTCINLVTPTHYTDLIIDAINMYRPKIPIVWNTSGYESVETIEKLKKYVDIFLCDFKYYNEQIAFKYSNAKNYPSVCEKALLKMREVVGEDLIENGFMKKGVIVRHLVLPNCTDDSVNVLNWIKDNMGIDTYISLMAQYTPCFRAVDFPQINRVLKPLEYKKVMNHAIKLGFKNGFFQDTNSASDDFIPNFDDPNIFD